MREKLVRYLLGELNSQEEEQLEAQLRDSPELRRELEYLQACLPPTDDLGEVDFERPAAADAPRGLAERTADSVCGDLPCGGIAHTPAEIAAAYGESAGTPSWSLADLTVAGGVFLAISMLFLPALRQSRDAARRTDCSNNQRQLGVMLISYSETKGNYLLTPARNENAGIFAVYLLEEGYAGFDELSQLLVCRSSPFAEKRTCNKAKIHLPSLCEISAATAQELCLWKHTMSPCYAARIGYVQRGQYCAVRNEGSCRKTIMADSACEKYKNLQSDHHGGQNVLYEDGSSRFQVQPTLPEGLHDVIYLNNDGKVAAGLGPNDTVLGRSEVMPGRIEEHADEPRDEQGEASLEVEPASAAGE